MTLKLLHNEPDDPKAKLLVKAIKGCFDALEKKYVSMFRIIGVCKKLLSGKEK